LKWVPQWISSALCFTREVLMSVRNIGRLTHSKTMGRLSPRWLRQHRQSDRVEFHGVDWTWPVTTKVRTDTHKRYGKNSNTGTDA
jgi:hypothetical protein|tara:strand:- start:2301 stop:2555 length:255 start_codon:yes stop_codon:yes gene_type:complete